MNLVKEIRNRDVYQISFWGTFLSYFIIPVILLIPFIFLIVTKTDYDFLTVMSIFIDQQNSSPDIMNKILIFSVIIEVVSRVIMIVLIVSFLKNYLIGDAKKFSKNLPINIVIIVGGFIAILLVNLLITLFYQLIGIKGDSANEEAVREMLNSNMRPFMVIVVVILAPILEELMFRKILIGFLIETLHLHKVVAFSISAFVFAFVHVIGDFQEIIFIIPYLALSIVITLSYAFSKNNIYVPIGVHFLNNLLAIFAV
ncbi:MAG TPA: CPBP family intramembrane metalloprotease [Acholeplasmataceae bacterium]|jgi:membrane protease YdiL (CAAX protease family)|nr:CPBP family intramembrane metalloprotease [Acholeplasmataceae bacterium]